tara:strand:- start:2418 stop:2972 length:555 start_codon:yes stop_codon:yes gene_type:complete
MYLQNIIDKLSEQRKLSETLSSLLWEIYGDDDVDEEQAIINSMKIEADRLMTEIKKKEQEVNSKMGNSRLKKMLNYVESWLAEYNSSFQIVKKALKDGRYMIAGNKDKVALAKAAAKQFGDEEKFVSLYKAVLLEKGQLIQYIKNPQDIPKEWNGYNTYNNNNNIYYLINYYYMENGIVQEVKL